MKRGQVTQFIILGLIVLILLIEGNVNADKSKCEKAMDLAEQGAKNNIKSYAESLERQNEILRISQAAYKDKVLKNVPDFVDKTKTNIKVDIVIKEGTISQKFEVLLKDKEGNSVALIKRELYKDSDTKELVMSNELIKVDESYEKQGLATQIYLNEDKYYRNIGVDRVDIKATDKGRKMWAKKEFGFKFKDYDFANRQFNSWLVSDEGKIFLKSDKGKIYLQSIKNGGKSDKSKVYSQNINNEGISIYNLGNNPYLYPEEFLLSDRFMNTIFYRKYLK